MIEVGRKRKLLREKFPMFDKNFSSPFLDKLCLRMKSEAYCSKDIIFDADAK
jgi:hypothetical protein